MDTTRYCWLTQMGGLDSISRKMNMQHISLLAGMISTSIFTLSHFPMLIRAFRTKDLRSYSAANLMLANVGNAFHWLYIVNLPFGPIWFLHSFYTLVAGMMLFWYLRYRRTSYITESYAPLRAASRRGADKDR